MFQHADTQSTIRSYIHCNKHTSTQPSDVIFEIQMLVKNGPKFLSRWSDIAGEGADVMTDLPSRRCQGQTPEPQRGDGEKIHTRLPNPY